MRYWVFQNFRVTGPFEVDALGRIAGFSPTTLVCPDLKSGMDAESWTRAGTVPELAAALYPALQRASARPAVRVPEPPAPPPPPGMVYLSALEALREQVRSLEEGAVELRAGQAAKDAELARLKAQAEAAERVHDAAFQGLRAELAAREEELALYKARAEAEESAAGELKAKLAGFEAVGAEPGAIEARMRELAEEGRALRAACAELREKLILRDAEAVRLASASPAPGAELEQVRQEARAALVRVLELRLILKALEERAGLAPPEPAPAAAPPGALPTEPAAPEEPAAPPAPAAPPFEPALRRGALVAALAGGLAGAAVAQAVSLLSKPAKTPSEPPARTAVKPPPAAAPAAAPKKGDGVLAPKKSAPAVQADEEEAAPELPSIYRASRKAALPPGW